LSGYSQSQHIQFGKKTENNTAKPITNFSFNNDTFSLTDSGVQYLRTLEALEKAAIGKLGPMDKPGYTYDRFLRSKTTGCRKGHSASTFNHWHFFANFLRCGGTPIPHLKRRMGQILS
jgi:hypothetical protein